MLLSERKGTASPRRLRAQNRKNSNKRTTSKQNKNTGTNSVKPGRTYEESAG